MTQISMLNLYQRFISIRGEPEPFERACTSHPAKLKIPWIPAYCPHNSRQINKHWYQNPQETMLQCKPISVKTGRYFVCKHLKRAARNTIERLLILLLPAKHRKGGEHVRRHFYCFPDPSVSLEKLLALFYKLDLIVLSDTQQAMSNCQERQVMKVFVIFMNKKRKENRTDSECPHHNAQFRSLLQQEKKFRHFRPSSTQCVGLSSYITLSPVVHQHLRDPAMLTNHWYVSK